MKVVFRIHAAKKGQEMKMQYEEKKEHRFKLGSLQAVKRVIKLQTGAKIDDTLTERKNCFSEETHDHGSRNSRPCWWPPQQSWKA